MPRINPVPEKEQQIGKRFRQVRRDSGLPQTVLGRKLNCDVYAVMRVEFGRVPLRYELGRAFCRHFQISPGWLAIGKGSQQPWVDLPALKTLGLPDRALFSEGFRRYQQLQRQGKLPRTMTANTIIENLEKTIRRCEEEKAQFSEHADVGANLDSIIAGCHSAIKNLHLHREEVARMASAAIASQS